MSLPGRSSRYAATFNWLGTWRSRRNDAFYIHDAMVYLLTPKTEFSLKIPLAIADMNPNNPWGMPCLPMLTKNLKAHDDYMHPQINPKIHPPKAVKIPLHNTTSNTIHRPLDLRLDEIPIRSPLRELIDLFGAEDAMEAIAIRDDSRKLLGVGGSHEVDLRELAEGGEIL